MELRGQEPCLSCSTPCETPLLPPHLPPKKKTVSFLNSFLSSHSLLSHKLLSPPSRHPMFYSSDSRWTFWASQMISGSLFSCDRRGMSGILNSLSFVVFIANKVDLSTLDLYTKCPHYILPPCSEWSCGSAFCQCTAMSTIRCKSAVTVLFFVFCFVLFPLGQDKVTEAITGRRKGSRRRRRRNASSLMRWSRCCWTLCKSLISAPHRSFLLFFF